MRDDLARAMTDHAILDAMRTYGGSFVQQLAVLFLHADPVNQARLKAAFPDYWAKYAEFVSGTREP